MTDITSAVNICTLLHRYYAEFMAELIPSLAKIFQPDKTEMSRKRATLRLLTELYIYGLFSDYPLIHKILEKIVDDFDSDSIQNLALVLGFVRYARKDLLGIERRKKPVTDGEDPNNNDQSSMNESDLEDPEDQPIVEENGRKKFKESIRNCFRKSSILLVKLHTELRSKEKENREIENTKGELGDEAMAAYKKQREEYEKVLNNVTALADYLQCDMPELPEQEKTTRMVVSFGNDLPKTTQPVKESPLWDDEGMRQFYEDLVDLSTRVPPVLLGISNDDKKEEEEQEKKKTKIDERPIPGAPVDDDKDDNEYPQQDRLSELFTRLESCMNIDKIDSAAVDFCYFNNKGNRKKLVNFLFGVPRTKLEILPYYARLIATLNLHMKDIGPLLVQKLFTEFETLYNEKHQLKIESKIKNIRFLSELVKFKVCSPNDIFKCLKMCLDDFVHHNVDVACALLETCGRYLYKTPETHMRTKTMMERMIRLKEGKNFDNKQETMIENAFFSCQPPERPAMQKRERTPLELFLRKLIFTDLSDKNVKAITIKLRKLKWPEQEDEVMNLLLKVHKGRYNTIHNVASIVAGLAAKHEIFGIKFVDALLEEIRVGLESNDYMNHQKLIVYVKFFGELYNYRLIDHPLIFDMLFFIINPEHLIYDSDNNSERDGDDTNDSATDGFRIRLVCTLLDTCGEFFTRGSTRDRLDNFLLHFQKYILSKTYIPSDLVFMIDDTFDALKIKIIRYKTNEEVDNALKAAPTKNGWGVKSYKITPTPAYNDDEYEEEAIEKETTPQVQDNGEEVDDTEDTNDEQNQGSENYVDTYDDDMDEEEFSMRPKASEYIACEEDDEFAKEYESMLSEDREKRKIDTSQRVNISNLAIPMNIIRRNTSQDEESSSSSSSSVSSPVGGIRRSSGGGSAGGVVGGVVGGVGNNNEVDQNDFAKFKFLVKKGGKQKAVDLDIPRTTKLVSQHLKVKEDYNQQQQEMKRLILNYDERDRKQNFDEANKKKKPNQKVLVDMPTEAWGFKSQGRGRGGGGGGSGVQASPIQDYNVDDELDHDPRKANYGASSPVKRGGGSGGSGSTPSGAAVPNKSLQSRKR
eukprot:TRINITY_DN7077_c0_g3_i5.p1 TRINITY_DN7077_c0_g3~~TRINITY_DN7077_c0_g3_i5.p1  ORF type:complete len:1281 (+),score=421.17 TRINITY_DN7077_c0_g3_i5:575-3844(+)